MRLYNPAASQNGQIPHPLLTYFQHEHEGVWLDLFSAPTSVLHQHHHAQTPWNSKNNKNELAIINRRKPQIPTEGTPPSLFPRHDAYTTKGWEIADELEFFNIHQGFRGNFRPIRCHAVNSFTKKKNFRLDLDLRSVLISTVLCPLTLNLAAKMHPPQLQYYRRKQQIYFSSSHERLFKHFPCKTQNWWLKSFHFKPKFPRNFLALTTFKAKFIRKKDAQL